MSTVSELLTDIIHRVGRQVLEENGAPFILRAMNRIYQRVNEELSVLERELWLHFSASDQKLEYDTKTASFTVGKTLTGGASGATGTILQVRDDGDNTGTLILSGVTGTYEADETITDNNTPTPGSAKATDANESAKSIALPDDVLRPIRMAPYRRYRDASIYSVNENKTFTIIDRRLYVSDADNESAFLLTYLSSGKTLVETVSDTATEVATPEWPGRYRQYLLYATAIELNANYPMYQQDVIREAKLRSQLQSMKYLKQEVTPEAYNPYHDVRRPVNFEDYGLSEFL